MEVNLLIALLACTGPLIGVLLWSMTKTEILHGRKWLLLALKVTLLIYFYMMLNSIIDKQYAVLFTAIFALLLILLRHAQNFLLNSILLFMSATILLTDNVLFAGSLFFAVGIIIGTMLAHELKAKTAMICIEMTAIVIIARILLSI